MNILWGCLIYFLAIALYYFPVFCAVKMSISVQLNNPVGLLKRSVEIIVFIVIAMIFTIILISQDKFIYFWDYSGYWSMSITASELTFEQPLDMVGNLIFSINHNDYNYYAALLLALPLRVLGAQFINYVMICFLMFVVPTAIVVYLISINIFSANNTGQTHLPVIVILFFMMPQVLIPLLNGYIDCVGLLLIASILLLVLNLNMQEFNLHKNILISVMLINLVLLRRYYAYFVVGFLVGFIVYIMITILQNKNEWGPVITNAIKFFIVLLVTSAAIFIPFFSPFLFRGILNNYAVAYSAYSSGNIFDKFITLAGAFGFVICGLFFLGMISGLRNKNIMAYTGLLTTNIFTSCLLFFRVQNMGIQHVYIVLIEALLLIIILFGDLSKKLNKGMMAIGKNGILLLLFGANLLNAYAGLPIIFEKNHLLSAETYRPKIRNDISTIKTLDAKLKSYDKTIYVVSSSTTLNESILYNAFLPETAHYLPKLLGSTNVDLRDGFATTFFNADVVVVGDPVQYHLAPDGQKTVGILAREILSGKLKDNFSLEEEYLLDNGVKAKVFIKIKPIDQDQIIYLADEFGKLYPEYPALFRDRILSYLKGLG